MTKLAPLGTVWIVTAKIKIIDTKSNKWKTLASCMDTPAVIESEVTRLRAAGHTSIWVFHGYGDRELLPN